MKTTRSPRTVLAALVLLLGPSAAPLLAQGNLDPAASPAPGMKRLDQVEARTIVNEANCPRTSTYGYAITPDVYPNGGSFYLTGNLNTAGGGIYISASNVTLDLNGFTLSNAGSRTLFNGIYISGSNVSVTNGGITGNGYASALSSASGTANVAARNLNISACGNGISITNGLAQGCTVNAVGGVGIAAPVVANSIATNCTGTAINATTVENVTGTTTSTGPAVIPTPLPQVVATLADTRTRIPGGTTGYVISTPGSYLLTGNLKLTTGEGIKINCSGVTLDLGGFTLSSTESSHGFTGISIASSTADLTGIVIENGNITSSSTVDRTTRTYSEGPGFADGVGFYAGTHKIRNAVVRNVTVSGCAYGGITGDNCQVMVDSCTCSCAGAGIVNVDMVTNSYGEGNTFGISANGQVQNSQGYGLGPNGTGISSPLVIGSRGTGYFTITATNKFNCP